MNTSEFQIDILHNKIESMIKAHYQTNIKKIIKEVVKNKDKDAKELEAFILDNLFEPVQKKTSKKEKPKQFNEDIQKKLEDTIPDNEKEFWGDDDVKQSYYPDKTTSDESKPCEKEDPPVQSVENEQSVEETQKTPVENEQSVESVAESSTPAPIEEKQKKPAKRQPKKKESVEQPPTESVAESSTPAPIEEKQKKPAKRQPKKKESVVQPPTESVVDSTQAQQVVENVPKPDESFQSQKSFESDDEDEVTSKMEYEPDDYGEEPF